MIPSNFNDQHCPGLDGVATEPINILDTCCSQCYLGRDSLPIRPNQRVVLVSRGIGTVQRLGNLVEQKAFIQFDSGISMYIPCVDLFHL